MQTPNKQTGIVLTIAVPVEENMRFKLGSTTDLHKSSPKVSRKVGDGGSGGSGGFGGIRGSNGIIEGQPSRDSGISGKAEAIER